MGGTIDHLDKHQVLVTPIPTTKGAQSKAFDQVAGIVAGRAHEALENRMDISKKADSLSARALV